MAPTTYQRTVQLVEVSKTINAETAIGSTLREASYVEDPQRKPKDTSEQSLVDLLLLEKIPLAGIARATGVSESWLQNYVNACYEWVPKVAEVMPKAKGKSKVQMDELWSFVDERQQTMGLAGH